MPALVTGKPDVAGCSTVAMSLPLRMSTPAPHRPSGSAGERAKLSLRLKLLSHTSVRLAAVAGGVCSSMRKRRGWDL